MTSAQNSKQANTSVTDGIQVPESLSAQPERAAIWNIERDLWRPRTISVQGDWGEAVALTSARPHTSYRKIVDVVATTSQGFHTAVKASVEDRGFVGDNNPAPILIRFEEHPNIAPLSDDFAAELTRLGFVREPEPAPSIPS
ncbi:MAG TPA: hypothetical protein VLZ31_07485, partial [Microbacteriaceae bacterium]|nr:hypothetical protein [Microbacteriaceae bacterium]